MLRKVILILSLLFVTTSTAYSQNTETESNLSEDARALQFRITENFTLGTFQGGILSYKWHSGVDRANRVSLSLIASVLDRSGEGDERLNSMSRINLGVGVNYSRIHYPNPDADIKFFFGYGPGFNVSYLQSENQTRQLRAEIRQTGFGFSFSGLAGVEWFFHNSISLHAEYAGSFRYDHTRLRQERLTETEGGSNSNQLVLAGDGVRFGLSVYF